MDAIDHSILKLLKENSRQATTNIAESVHLSVPAVAERIRKLKENGYIKQFTVRIGREKLGKSLLAFIFVSLAGPQYIDSFIKMAVQEEAVLECHHIAGDYDYLLKAVVAGTNELEQLVSFSLKSIEGVTRTNTIIALSTVKEEI